jgi:hypothetical protein
MIVDVGQPVAVAFDKLRRIVLSPMYGLSFNAKIFSGELDHLFPVENHFGPSIGPCSSSLRYSRGSFGFRRATMITALAPYLVSATVTAAFMAFERTALRVSSKDRSSDVLDTRRTIGSTNQRSETGISRLNAIASIST